MLTFDNTSVMDCHPFLGRAQGSQLGAMGNSYDLGSPDSSVLPEEIQNEFCQIKDSLSKVTLPLEARFHSARVSVKRKDQPQYNVIANWVAIYPC